MRKSYYKQKREFSKMADDEIMQKSITFLCASNNSLENKMEIKGRKRREREYLESYFIINVQVLYKGSLNDNNGHKRRL